MRVKRDDLIHPIVSGNKWRKLSALFNEGNPIPHIVSFGGGYSNHLHSLAFCCSALGIPLTAIVRGDYTNNPTPMLKDLQQWKVNIRFVSKVEYQQRATASYLAALSRQYPDAIVVPEGGSQASALAGVQQLLTELQKAPSIVVSPVASGATLAGIIRGLSSHQRALGIAVLKGQGYLESTVAQFLPSVVPAPWSINHRFHHGGYAKKPQPLIDLCEEMARDYNIPVEPVYSGKVFFAIKSLLAQEYFDEGEEIVILHTGGLQAQRV